MVNKRRNHGLDGLKDCTDGMEGYKRTEVGVIPVDWEVKKIGDICNFIVPGRNKPKKFDGDIPWITTPDLEDGRSVSYSRLDLCISRDEAKNVGSKIVPAGSVLMSCAGELGIVAFTEKEIVINQQLHAFIPSFSIDAFFLLNAIKSQKKYIDGVATKTAVPYINKDNCNSIPIPIPPLAEQKTIAQCLSDTYALIAACDRAITKKRNIKQGAMQQLLTGKVRLPGFSGEWEVKEVGKICDFIVPGRNKPLNFDGDIPWITTPDLEDGRSVSKSRLGLCISRDEAKNVGSKIVPAGSIIMSCAGELGIVAFVKNEIVINQQLHAFLPSSGIDALFLINAIKSQKKYIDGVATKTAVPYINKDNCNSIPIFFPPLSEQKAIAQILSDMDAEIAALEKKRDKYKAIKQGMMQELLTGKTRLKDNTDK